MKTVFEAKDFDESDKPFEAQCGACGLRHNIQWPVDATCLPGPEKASPWTFDEVRALATEGGYSLNAMTAEDYAIRPHDPYFRTILRGVDAAIRLGLVVRSK